jgi:hypothetical protein
MGRGGAGGDGDRHRFPLVKGGAFPVEMLKKRGCYRRVRCRTRATPASATTASAPKGRAALVVVGSAVVFIATVVGGVVSVVFWVRFGGGVATVVTVVGGRVGAVVFGVRFGVGVGVAVLVVTPP